MKERPIRFKDWEVRAVLDGQKTQTRRVALTKRSIEPMSDECPFGQPGDRLWVKETCALQTSVENESPPFSDGRPVLRLTDDGVDCLLPLWTQPHYRATDPVPDLTCDRDGCAQCRDHGMGPHWRPSIHMPRWACRLVLEITDVRVERLQAISEEDALAEGIKPYADGHGFHTEDGRLYAESAKSSFAELWTSTGGDWDANPWVWVVSFRRVEA